MKRKMRGFVSRHAGPNVESGNGEDEKVCKQQIIYIFFYVKPNGPSLNKNFSLFIMDQIFFFFSSLLIMKMK